MLREEIVQVWSGLKTKFNQLSHWPKTFPNQKSWQVQEKINTLQSNYVSSFETIKQKNAQLSNLTNEVNQKNAKIDILTIEVNLLQEELNKEKSWWYKWLRDDSSYLTDELGIFIFKLPNGEKSYCPPSEKIVFKNIIKNDIYPYYRDK